MRKSNFDACVVVNVLISLLRITSKGMRLIEVVAISKLARPNGHSCPMSRKSAQHCTDTHAMMVHSQMNAIDTDCSNVGGIPIPCLI